MAPGVEPLALEFNPFRVADPCIIILLTRPVFVAASIMCLVSQIAEPQHNTA
jgi:hypothetical protein